MNDEPSCRGHSSVAIAALLCLSLVTCIFSFVSASEMPDSNLAFECTYEYETAPGIVLGYTYDNATTKLTDGVISIGDYNDDNYTIWNDVDAVTIFDLASSKTIDKVSFHTISRTGFNIYFPIRVAVSVSADDVTYTEVYNATTTETNGNPVRAWMVADFNETAARYVKLYLFHYTTGGDKDTAVSEVVIEHVNVIEQDEAKVVTNQDFDGHERFIGYIDITNATYGLEFYNDYLWSSSYGQDKIEKIDPATGTTVSVITARDKPFGLVWDSTNSWFWYYAETDDLFVAIDTAGAEQRTFALNEGLALNEDGLGQTTSNLILVDDAADKAWFISKTDGSNVTNVSIKPESEGIAEDEDGSQWVLTELPDRITKYASDFESWNYSIPSVYGRSTGIAIDQDNEIMYVSAEFDAQITAFDMSDQSYGLFDRYNGSWGYGELNGTENNQYGFTGTDYSGLRTVLSHNFDDYGIITFDTWAETFDVQFTGHIPLCAGNEQIGFIWGYQDEYNYNILWFSDTSDRVYYNAYINGTLTWPTWNQYGTSFTITASSWTIYRIAFDGSTLTIYNPGGSTVFTTKDWSAYSPWTTGKVGFGHWTGPFDIDSFSLRPYDTDYEGTGDYYLESVSSTSFSMTTYDDEAVSTFIPADTLVLYYSGAVFSTCIVSTGTWINFTADTTEYDFVLGMTASSSSTVTIFPLTWDVSETRSGDVVATYNVTATDSAIITFTFIGADSETGYRVFQDGSYVAYLYSPDDTFSATGGGQYVIEVWYDRQVSALIVLTVDMIGLGIVVSVIGAMAMPYARDMSRRRQLNFDKMMGDVVKTVVFIVVGIVMWMMLHNIVIG